MPYDIIKTGEGKGFVVNTKTGRHFSRSPIPLANAERQLRLLNTPESKHFRPPGVKHTSDSESHSSSDSDPPKEKFIQEVVSSPKFKKGAFTAQAKEHNMTTMDFMKEVLAHPDKYDATTRKRAQFMKNIQ
jgi:hypothetical protein